MIRKAIIVMLTLLALAWVVIRIDCHRARTSVQAFRTRMEELERDAVNLRRANASGLRPSSPEEQNLILSEYNDVFDRLLQAQASGCGLRPTAIELRVRRVRIGIFTVCDGVGSPPKSPIMPGTLAIRLVPGFVQDFKFVKWDRGWHLLGFRLMSGAVSGVQGRTGRACNANLPPWAVLCLLGAYPTFAFIRGPVWRNRRRRRGLCVRCGYNLTGNVSSVCPECGREC